MATLVQVLIVLYNRLWLNDNSSGQRSKFMVQAEIIIVALLDVHLHTGGSGVGLKIWCVASRVFPNIL